jgi:SAM-dependent methyltransferase
VGLDNDLAGRIARTWPGLLPAEFERRFVETVESSAADRLQAWTAFYVNTLAGMAAGAGLDPGGTIAEFAPVHARAAALVRGRDVVELGCCFGFLSLRMAEAGHQVTGVDLSAGTAALLHAVSRRLGRPVHAVTGDATAVPLAGGCADTVYAVHLLEHLPTAAGAAALREMLRLARRRVVVAVPFEDQPNPVWGHVRCFDTAVLAALGAGSGWRFEVSEHHGGWLVLDR